MRAATVVMAMGSALWVTACGGELQPEEGLQGDLTTETYGLTAAASVDPVLRVPTCNAAASGCSASSAMLTGRDSQEANAPNTLGGCADAPAASYPSGVSIDRLSVATNDGSLLQEGKTALVNVTFRPSTWPSGDRVDLFTASDASAPVWTLVGTFAPTSSSQQTRTFSFPIGAAGAARRAVRAQVRPSFAAAAPCSGALDADDLVFTLAGPPQLSNAGFEAGLTGWAPGGGVTAGAVAFEGSGAAAFVPVYPTLATISQRVQIPAGATTLSFWYLATSTNTTSLSANLRVVVAPASGNQINVPFVSNLSASPSWRQHSVNVSAMAGQVVTLSFQAQNQWISRETTFRLDAITLQ